MRLMSFVNERQEGTVMPFDADKIRKECADYISKDSYFPERPLFRALYKDHLDQLQKNDNYSMMKMHSYVNSGRHPLDTDREMHITLNELFKEKFGWNVRDGVFAVRQRTSMMRHVVIFIPIGQIKYVWSPSITDLVNKTYQEMDDEQAIKKIVDTYIDKDISKAAQQEISFNCKSYYCIDFVGNYDHDLDYFKEQMEK